jgi:hypothetical protein
MCNVTLMTEIRLVMAVVLCSLIIGADVADEPAAPIPVKLVRIWEVTQFNSL